MLEVDCCEKSSKETSYMQSETSLEHLLQPHLLPEDGPQPRPVASKGNYAAEPPGLHSHLQWEQSRINLLVNLGSW